MTRCRPHVAAYRGESIIPDDIHCSCKPSLIVSCAVGAVSGCRERHRDGTCGCKPRYLPTCILDTPAGAGCGLWREGKTCYCTRLYMPRCLAVGCADRRRGKRCECPRTPVELCPHVLAALTRHASMTAREAELEGDSWAESLWTLDPADYADRPAAFAGVTVQTREAAVNLMAARQAWGFSPWHVDDRRGLDGDGDGGAAVRRRMERQAAGLRRLLGIGAGKAGAA